MRICLRAAEILDGIIDWIGRIAAWLVLGLVILIAAEVLMRYVFDRSSIAAQELEWWVLAIISLLGISYTLKHGGHVRVDILYQYYGERARAWFDFLSAVFVMVPVSFYIAYLSLYFVGQSYGQHEASQSPGGLSYVWLLKAFVPAGFALLGVQGVAVALRNGARLLDKREGGKS